MNDQGIIKKGEGKYYNPDPLYRLIGRTNKAKLIIDGHETTGLIDSGANISAISKSFAEELGLPFRQLKSLLEIEGSGGIDVPYLGYTEVNLKVPGVKSLDEDILVVIQNDSAYSAKVPITLGTLHIDLVIEKATSKELANQRDFHLSFLCSVGFQEYQSMWSLVSLYLTYRTPVDKIMHRN